MDFDPGTLGNLPSWALLVVYLTDKVLSFFRERQKDERAFKDDLRQYVSEAMAERRQGRSTSGEHKPPRQDTPA